MKRLVFLLSAILVFFVTQAQEVAIPKNKSYGSYTTATAVSGTTANNMDVVIDKNVLYYYDIQWAADSAGDGTDFTLQLAGSNDESNYYNIGSTVTWAVSETDTIVQFTNNPSSETWTVASHTRTTAQKTDYHDLDFPARNEYHAFDSATGSDDTWADTLSVAAYVLTDTATIGAAVQTVAEQTYTISKQYPVGWRYLRVTATGGGSGAGCSITSFTVAIKED